MNIEDIATHAARELLDTEVAFFHEHGWVKLDGLISSDTAAELLRISKGIMADAPKEKGWQCRESFQYNWGFSYFTIGKIKIDPFPKLALSKTMGRAASRLIDRVSPCGILEPPRLRRNGAT